MKSIPSVVSAAWGQREDRMVFATVGADGMPNVIWILCAHLEEGRVIIADNFMSKTKANVEAGSRGSLLFIAPERKAYQIKGTLKYHAAGPVYEAMKHGWLDAKFAGKGAVELVVEEVYCGAERLL